MVVHRKVRRLGLAVGIGALMLTSGCRELAQPGVASDAGVVTMKDQLVFVYDRSVSIKDHELEHAMALTRQRVRSLDHGDRIVAIELLEQELAEEPTRWATQVPDREFTDREMPQDSIAKARFIRDVEDYIVRFGAAEGREDIGGTDILSTLHLVAEELHAQPGHRTTFFLFSDMLQANQVMNLEGLTRMPADNWVQQQAESGTLPDLTGLCVVLVGPREDTEIAQVVKHFWTEYFEVTGATLLDRNYSYRPVSLPEKPCAGA